MANSRSLKSPFQAYFNLLDDPAEILYLHRQFCEENDNWADQLYKAVCPSIDKLDTGGFEEEGNPYYWKGVFHLRYKGSVERLEPIDSGCCRSSMYLQPN